MPSESDEQKQIRHTDRMADDLLEDMQKRLSDLRGATPENTQTPAMLPLPQMPGETAQQPLETFTFDAPPSASQPPSSGDEPHVFRQGDAPSDPFAVFDGAAAVAESAGSPGAQSGDGGDEPPDLALPGGGGRSGDGGGGGGGSLQITGLDGSGGGSVGADDSSEVVQELRQIRMLMENLPEAFAERFGVDE